MGAQIPDLSEDEFRDRLSGYLPFELDPDQIGRLYAHFRELRRWNSRLALVGSGVVDQVVERLFGESLDALPLIGGDVRRILDVGSGAGFPGLVLAAARPDLEVFLVEPRERKWAFLRAAAARASLSCACLNARVSAALPSGLPESVDRVTVRALRLEPQQIRALATRLTPGGSFLIWAGADRGAPDGLRESRAIELGSGRGRIQELVWTGSEST